MPEKMDIASVVQFILACKCKERLQTILTAAKTRINELEHQEQYPPGKAVPLGVDVSANPGRNH
jgi:hypothetical protein